MAEKSTRSFVWLSEYLEDPDMLKPPTAVVPRLVWANRLTLLAAREKGGKALALDTPIPTPTGWKIMGDLVAGDEIFDEQGEICRVVVAGEVQYNRPVYEVLFSDGERIVADAEHEWLTTSYTPRDLQAIRTTREIANSLTSSKPGLRNHRIGVCDTLNLPDADLPIPPYTLGFWLGDGHSASARITIGTKDAPDVLYEIHGEGVPTKKGKSPNAGSDIYVLGGDRAQEARDQSVQARLRHLNLLDNKHIPQIYLRGSYEQRMTLLRGLMDSDGYVTQRGRCNFDTTSPRLRDGVVELLRTLSFKPHVSTKRATLYGKDCGEAYRVTFTAYEGTPIAGLPRKIERLKKRPEKLCRSRGRKIVDVRAVESVPVRCIQVDSPSRLFLAGRGFIPTHNSTIAGAAAAAVSRGGSFLGTIADPGNVLIVSLEEHPQEFTQRLVRFGCDPARIAIVEQKSSGEELIKAIVDAAEEVQPKFIIWDTLGAFANAFSNKNIEPGDSAAWTRVMMVILEITRLYGASLLLHHSRKSDGKYRDSTAIGANVDIILEMFGEDDEPRTIKGKGRFPIPEIRVKLEPDGFTIIESAAEFEKRVLAFVEEHPKCSMRDLREGVEGKNADLARVRDKLLKEGLIANVGPSSQHQYIAVLQR